MRRTALIVLATAALMIALVSPAAARGGLSSAQLEDAGWECFPVPGLGIHCTPPGVSFGDRHVQILYFDEATGEFAGTETLVRADAFSGNRQCPTEPEGYFFIPPLGYYACHRN